jgi:hypothetical protein
MTAKVNRRFLCLGCGVDTSGRTGIAEYYMVTKQV